jgi:hypothetical protein
MRMKRPVKKLMIAINKVDFIIPKKGIKTTANRIIPIAEPKRSAA